MIRAREFLSPSAESCGHDSCPGVSVVAGRKLATEDICENAIELAQVKQYVEPGDVVVITAGIPSTNVSKERSFTSNMMRIATVD